MKMMALPTFEQWLVVREAEGNFTSFTSPPWKIDTLRVGPTGWERH